MSSRGSLGRKEIWVSGITAIGFWYVLYLFALGPLTKDELKYMYFSLFPTEYNPFIFRYFHIYLQKLFFIIWGNALSGARGFGTFCVATTAYLVYICARLICENKTNIYAPIVAVFLFISSSMVLPYLGVTWADTTLMMVTMATIIVYIVIVQSPGSKKYLLKVLLGLCVYFALRTKETGFMTVFLVVGIGLSTKHTKKNVANTLLPIGLGVVIGQAAMMVCDSIFMENCWFTLSSGSYHKRIKIAKNILAITMNQATVGEDASGRLATILTKGAEVIPKGRTVTSGDASSSLAVENWLAFIAQRDVAIMASLYLIGLIRSSVFEKNNGIRLLWVMPMIGLLYLVGTSGVRHWHLSLRYCLPMIPVFAALGAKYMEDIMGNIEVEQRGTYRKSIKTLSLLALLGVTLVLFKNREMLRIDNLQPLQNVSIRVIYPVLIISLFSLNMFVKNSPVPRAIIMFIVIGGGIAAPLARTAMIYKSKQIVSDERFYPLEAFKEELDYEKIQRMSISEGIYKEYGMLMPGAEK